MSSTHGYDHVQRGYLHWVVYAIAAVCLWAGIALLDGVEWQRSGEGTAALWVFFVSALVMLLLGMSFQYLRVHDRGDVLQIDFGPLPLLRREIPYAEIEAVQPGRTSWIDGWGIHLVPGRGWTWNIWGWHCVELTVAGSRLRVGTDDPEGLDAFLRARLAERGRAAGGQVEAGNSK